MSRWIGCGCMPMCPMLAEPLAIAEDVAVATH
jgi:hypothetical protein